MGEQQHNGTSRRGFLKNTGRVAAASTLVGAATQPVFAAEDNTLQVALIGCGGRGTGAADNALSVKQGPLKLVALADVFENRVRRALTNLKNKHKENVDVPEDRQFVGFDAYQRAMDCLKPGDVVIFATPLAFRWVHFALAIEKGLHVFMEKPLTADGPSSRKMLDLAEQSKAKNLKVGVGLMSRHQRALEELADRIHGGEIGDILTMRAYRMSGPIGSCFSNKWPGTDSELLWQIQRFHSFLWASGGAFSDFCIHVIDHCCWMKNDWPIKAHALGGRHYRGDAVDQNFDSYAVEYTFADGAKLFTDGRNVAGAQPMYHSYAHGAKGSAVISKHGDCGRPSSTYSSQTPDDAKKIWQSEVPADQRNPYQNEWNDLVDAIRNDKPFNEAQRGVKASLVTSMGRMAAHSGLEISYDDMLNSDHEYAPDVDKWTMGSPPPLVSDEAGKYPIPMPGLLGKREY
jgi:predicted dehydrogenase